MGARKKENTRIRAFGTGVRVLCGRQPRKFSKSQRFRRLQISERRSFVEKIPKASGKLKNEAEEQSFSGANMCEWLKSLLTSDAHCMEEQPVF